MTTCASCGIEISVGQGTALLGRGRNAPPITICRNCEAKLERDMEAETVDSNVAGALLLGLAAGFFSSLIWFGLVVVTRYQLGIVAIAVGWVIAKAVVLGSGNKRGPILQAISLGVTLTAMALSQYFIVRHFAVQALAEEGITGIPLFLPLLDTVSVIGESIAEDPITLLFWAIALFQAYQIPARRRLRRAPAGVAKP